MTASPWGCGRLYKFLMRGCLLLITRLAAPMSRWAFTRLILDWTEPDSNMSDVIYIGITVLFFVISGLYVRFCEKL
jgi:hypothetical protein